MEGTPRAPDSLTLDSEFKNRIEHYEMASIRYRSAFRKLQNFRMSRKKYWSVDRTLAKDSAGSLPLADYPVVPSGLGPGRDEWIAGAIHYYRDLFDADLTGTDRLRALLTGRWFRGVIMTAGSPSASFITGLGCLAGVGSDFTGDGDALFVCPMLGAEEVVSE